MGPNKMSKNGMLGWGMVILLMVTGCSTTRDGFAYRLYHNTNAKYNGFFYATEAMKEAEQVLDLLTRTTVLGLYRRRGRAEAGPGEGGSNPSLP